MRAVVYGVYRARNAALLDAVLRPVRRRWDVALWALDETAPPLAPETLGSGPGTKFELVNELYRRVPPAAGATVVVTDDDIAFTRGSLASFERLMRRAGLGLAQPSHDAESLASHAITRSVAGSRARLTTFVEIGPVFAVSARWREAVLPFAPDIGMGWGIELGWSRLAERGCRLGIVDAVRLRHLVLAGSDYDRAGAMAEMHARFAAAGVSGWAEVQRDLAVWRRLRPRPPWPTPD